MIDPTDADGGLDHDLEDIIETAANDLRAFAGARLFITGGTGFVGTWLLWSIAAANRRLRTRIKAVVLTRHPDRFTTLHPALAGRDDFQFVAGDVTEPFDMKDRFDGIVHAATPASADLVRVDPGRMLTIILRGGEHIAELAERCGPIPTLFTSSGAVYGRAPSDVDRLAESYGGAPDATDPRSVYAEGKRCAELQAAIAAQRSGGRACIARLFAFVGPFLPIDRHFAIGNFIRDTLAGGPIRVAGDGTTVRSYLYASDMVVWLWAIFARAPSCRPFNVGSDEAISIAGLAATVAQSGSLSEHDVITEKTAPADGRLDRYVPDVQRAMHELRLARRVSLRDAIERTLRWHRARMARIDG